MLGDDRLLAVAQELVKANDTQGKRLVLRVEVPEQVKWEVLELDKPVNPWDCSNKGFRRIAFTVPAAADGTATISVTLAP